MPYNQNKTNYRTLFAEIKQISKNNNLSTKLCYGPDVDQVTK